MVLLQRIGDEHCRQASLDCQTPQRLCNKLNGCLVRQDASSAYQHA